MGQSAVPLLVFSDLDGTLLDHHSYSADPARPVIARVLAAGGGVVLASSKTAAEMAVIRDDLGLGDWPALVENGAGVLEPGADPMADDAAYRTIRARLADLPPGFRGFGDMSVDEVADITGLPRDAAAAAKTRCFSEPGVWTGSDAAQDAFLTAARNAGLHARSGGRFLTLSLGGTKAQAMTEIMARFIPRVTMALGDAPNDAEMIEAADIGVIVANPGGTPLPPLAGEAAGRITRTIDPGPKGWAKAVSAVLDDI